MLTFFAEPGQFCQLICPLFLDTAHMCTNCGAVLRLFNDKIGVAIEPPACQSGGLSTLICVPALRSPLAVLPKL